MLLNIQPLRITLTDLPQSMSLAAFAKQRSLPGSLQKLAMMNQVDPQEPLPQGKIIKRVDGQLPSGARSEVI
ncbi:MAG TPA: hypothetical protein VE954_15755 [Oligoflexus sp.]|uniref:hypothetical protein n=1 Tax=Oligoflexus sp. TaxID=1971216 RepID=UPI002D5CCFEA|nr:hypothetical protein [Oligoflexus sp.]HYX34557.1 hypothetical protein [Oligoflexus sp.]